MAQNANCAVLGTKMTLYRLKPAKELVYVKTYHQQCCNEIIRPAYLMVHIAYVDDKRDL